MGPEDYSI